MRSIKSEKFTIPDDTNISKGRKIEDIQAEITEESLSQYTGVHDAKRNEIWEKDICCVRKTGVLVECVIIYWNGSFFAKETGKTDDEASMIELSRLESNGYTIEVK